jgi:hypothetical protein
LPLGVVPGEAVVSSVVGEISGENGQGNGNSNQGTLFHSDQAVGETLVDSAKVVVGAKAAKRVIRTVRVKKKPAERVGAEQSIANAALVGGSVTVQHDAVR